MSDSREPGLLSTAFLLCFAANLLQGIAFNLYLHFPGYLHELGATDLVIGWISSLTALAGVAVRAPVGRWMDRGGRRPVILAGGAVNVLALLLYLEVTSLGPLLYVVRVLHGLAEAMLFSSLFTFAADFVPARRRTQGLALFGVSGMLPIALAGVLGDWLIADDGYLRLFQVALGFAVASALLSLGLRDRPRAPVGQGETVGFLAALRQVDLAPLWLVGTVFSVVLTAFFIFIRRYVDETGIGTVGLFFSAYTTSALLLRVFFGWLPDRIGPKRVLLPALACLALGFVWMVQASTARDLAVAGLLCGIGHGYTFPILFGLVVTRTPEANRGMAMAIFTALFDLGVLAGGPLFGAVIQRFGFSAMFAVAAVGLCVGAALFFVWDERVAAARRSGLRAA